MSKCDERFARQYRYELPPEFPLASPCSDIVHHLSGPNKCAQTQTRFRRAMSAFGAPVPKVALTMRRGVKPLHSRTCMDSLVRVSRRAIRRLAGQHNGAHLKSIRAQAGSPQLAVTWPTSHTNTQRRNTTRYGSRYAITFSAAPPEGRAYRGVSSQNETC